MADSEAARNERPYSLAEFRSDGLRIDKHKHDVYTFDSVAEYWAAAARARKMTPRGRYEARRGRSDDTWLPPNPGGWPELMEMSRRGWQSVVDANAAFNDEMLETALVRTKALDTVEHLELAGSLVDVPLYAAGVPEHMVLYEEEPTTKRAVTLVVSCSYSWAVDADSRIRLGMALVAACRVLQSRGIATRIFADITIADDIRITYPNGYSKPCKYEPRGDTRTYRVTVKAFNDPGDLDLIAYGIAHPALLRVAAFYLNDASTRRRANQGYPCDPVMESYGEDDHAIMVPALITGNRKDGDALIDDILARVFAG